MVHIRLPYLIAGVVGLVILVHHYWTTVFLAPAAAPSIVASVTARPTSAVVAPDSPLAFHRRRLGLEEVYRRHPRFDALVSATWLQNGEVERYWRRRNVTRAFRDRHQHVNPGDRHHVRDVWAYMRTAEGAGAGIVVDAHPQLANPARHALPRSPDFQRACADLHLSKWWTCHRTPEECSRGMPATTHLLVVAVWNAYVDRGFCHPDVHGNVFTPSIAYYYQPWTAQDCYSAYVPLPGGYNFNDDRIEYYPELLNTVGVYGAAPGHFGPQHLPRVIRLLLTCPASARVLVSHSKQSEELMEVLHERGILTSMDRLVWYNSGRVYMGGVVYQSQAWPWSGDMRYLHDRTDMLTTHYALARDLPERERRLVVLVKRTGGRALSDTHHAAVLAFLRHWSEPFNLTVVEFQALGHVREHIAMFERAQVVVGPHGAGLFNAVFCKPNATSVLEIGYSSGMELHEMYAEIAIHMDLEYFLIRGTGDYSGPLVPNMEDLDWSFRQALQGVVARRMAT